MFLCAVAVRPHHVAADAMRVTKKRARAGSLLGGSLGWNCGDDGVLVGALGQPEAAMVTGCHVLRGSTNR